MHLEIILSCRRQPRGALRHGNVLQTKVDAQCGKLATINVPRWKKAGKIG